MLNDEKLSPDKNLDSIVRYFLDNLNSGTYVLDYMSINKAISLIFEKFRSSENKNIREYLKTINTDECSNHQL